MNREQKWDRLKALLFEIKSAVLAYSGGVDSSLLLKAASEVLGNRLIAVTAVSDIYPLHELKAAQAFAASLNVQHRILYTHELSSEDFVKNSPDRCYFCKKELFGKLVQIAHEEGILCVLDGSNVDDFKDYRPGSWAAAEFGVRSPLQETGFTKADIRECARAHNLVMWDKPPLACLSSRIPYGTRITREIVFVIQSAEKILHQLGFQQVRVRHYPDMARIEIQQEEFERILDPECREKIITGFKQLGYRYISLDLEGYRTGSMNEGLQIPDTRCRIPDTGCKIET
ncbi:MAG: ATP-dependent sacrificial sulfur transferase LarE [Nitrospirota bacterium]